MNQVSSYLDQVRPYLNQVEPDFNQVSNYLNQIGPYWDQIRPYLNQVRPHLNKVGLIKVVPSIRHFLQRIYPMRLQQIKMNLFLTSFKPTCLNS